MNLYGYWSKPLSALVKGNILFWTPYYRPFGGVIYRTFFAIFGFNPYPIYVVFYAAMLSNLWLAYLVFKRIGGSREIGASLRSVLLPRQVRLSVLQRRLDVRRFLLPVFLPRRS